MNIPAGGTQKKCHKNIHSSPDVRHISLWGCGAFKSVAACCLQANQVQISWNKFVTSCVNIESARNASLTIFGANRFFYIRNEF